MALAFLRCHFRQAFLLELQIKAASQLQIKAASAYIVDCQQDSNKPG